MSAYTGSRARILSKLKMSASPRSPNGNQVLRVVQMHGKLPLNNLVRTCAVSKNAKRTSAYMLTTKYGKQLIENAHKDLDALEMRLAAEGAIKGKLRARKSHIIDIQKRISQLGKIKKKAEKDLIMAMKIQRLTKKGRPLNGVTSMSRKNRNEVFKSLSKEMRLVYHALMYCKRFTRTKGGSPRPISVYINQLKRYIKMSTKELAAIERRIKAIYNGRNILNGLSAKE